MSKNSNKTTTKTKTSNTKSKQSSSSSKTSSTKKTSTKQTPKSATKKSSNQKSASKKPATKKSSSKKSSSKRNNEKAGSGLKTFLLLILLVFAGIYIYRGYQIKDCFFNGLIINNIDVRGMTVEEVEAKLSERASTYQLDITGREGAAATITSADIQYGYQSDGTIQQYFDEQNWLLWGSGYLGDNALEESRHVTVPMTYDSELLRSCMNSWSFLQPDQQRQPQDAYITYENDSYVIKSEVPGTAIDSEVLFQKLNEAVASTATSLNIEDTDAYIPVAVTSESALLQDNKNTLNTYANCWIQHTLPDGESMNITPEKLKSWLLVNEEGRYFKDEATFTAKTEQYVSELANKISTYNSDSVSFYGQDGDWHTIAKHTPLSWSLDVMGELAKLTEELNSGTSNTREPVYASRARATNSALAATYVEIDLSGQHLWYYENGSIVLDCDITSGTATVPERKTPDGLYKIQYKQRDRVLRGALLPDGTYEYESPVSYWMPFNGGIGLHDASWRDPDIFGGDYYLNNGSHGCINMPTKTAAALYDRIEKGCLVACYY